MSATISSRGMTGNARRGPRQRPLLPRQKGESVGGGRTRRGTWKRKGSLATARNH